MLFDLRSAGRRRTVKVLYIFLAIIMAGGLVFFGIGSSTSGGGLFDAITHPFGGGSKKSSPFEAQEKKLEKKVKVNPSDAQTWAQLASIRVQAANSLGNYDTKTGNVTFSSKSKSKLSEAALAWQRYTALKPKKPNPSIAAQMVTAYGSTGLNQAADAVDAQAIVANARPAFGNFATLALYAYLADQITRGNRAAKKAVELAPKAQKKLVKDQLAQFRAQAIVKKAQEKSGGQNGGGVFTPPKQNGETTTPPTKK